MARQLFTFQPLGIRWATQDTSPINTETGVGHHHHYHHQWHPAGARRRDTGHGRSCGIILVLLSTTSAIVKVWRIYLVAQSAPKALSLSMFPAGGSRLLALPHRTSYLLPAPAWGPSAAEFLSKLRQAPTSTCVAAAIYNNYHQMNKQTFVPLLSWTSIKGSSGAKGAIDPRDYPPRLSAHSPIHVLPTLDILALVQACGFSLGL